MIVVEPSEERLPNPTHKCKPAQSNGFCDEYGGHDDSDRPYGGQNSSPRVGIDDGVEAGDGRVDSGMRSVDGDGGGRRCCLGHRGGDNGRDSGCLLCSLQELLDAVELGCWGAI